MTIRRGEGTLGAKGYYTHFGVGLLSTLNNLPEYGKTWTKGNKHKLTTSEIGAYQFLYTKKHKTLQEIVSYFNFTDFSKQNQDLGALFLLDMQDALPAIVKGEILSAFKKTNSVWTSLPSSDEDPPTQKLRDALKFDKAEGMRLYGHDNDGEFGWHILFDIKRINEDAGELFKGNVEVNKQGSKRNSNNNRLIKDNNLGENAIVIGAIAPMGIQGSLMGLGLLELGNFIEEHLSNLKIPQPKRNQNKVTHGDGINLTTNQIKFPIEDWDSGFKRGMNAYEQLLIDKQLSLQDKAIHQNLLSLQLVPENNNLDKSNDAFFRGCIYDSRKYGYPELFNSYPRPYENALMGNSNKLATVKGMQKPKVIDFKEQKPGRQFGRQPSEPDRGRTVEINLNRAMIENFSIHTSNTKEGLVDFKSKVEEVLLEILSNANAIQ